MTSVAAEVTQVQSLAAIRNFIRVAVSCVTYLRGLCSDESYQPRQFLGLQLKQLMRTSPEADAISQWIEEGAFDALNKGYLKELSLCIYTPNCAELLESYCFALSYCGDGKRALLSFAGNSLKDGEGHPSAAASASSMVEAAKSGTKRRTRQEVQHALVSIITKLMEVVEGLPPLLCDRVLTMQLKYYEEVTPASYEPPCFAPANAHLRNLHHQEQKYKNNIASLETGHHTMSVTIRHRCLDRLWSEARVLAGSQTMMSPSFDTSTATATATTTTGVGEGAALMHVRMTDATHGHMDAAGSSTRKCSADEPGGCCFQSEELAFLVFASFVVTKSPAIHRGRISRAEIEEYLRVSCPLEITLEAAQRMMRRLEVDGTVSPEAREEWVVHAVPAATLAGSLLTQKRSLVLPLLSAQIRQDLECLITGTRKVGLCAAGKRKRTRKAS